MSVGEDTSFPVTLRGLLRILSSSTLEHLSRFLPKRLKNLFLTLLRSQKNNEELPRGREEKMFGTSTSPRRAANGNHVHGSNTSQESETHHAGRVRGTKDEFMPTSAATACGISAPKHGGGGGGGDGGDRGDGGAEDDKWHDLPTVQEFTQDEVNIAGAAYGHDTTRAGSPSEKGPSLAWKIRTGLGLVTAGVCLHTRHVAIVQAPSNQECES